MFFNYFKKKRYSATIYEGIFFILETDKYNNISVINENNAGGIACEFLLDHKDYDITVVEAPLVPAEEIGQALLWEAKNIFGEKNETLLFDFYHHPSNHYSSKKLINLVSAEKSSIDSIKRKAAEINLCLNKITIPEMAYKYGVSDASDGLCFVVVDKYIGKVVVVKGGEVCFSRKFSLEYLDSAGDFSYASLLLLELQRSLDYYERQYRMMIPADFIVLGDSVSSDIVSLVKENFGQNVHVSFSWNSLFDSYDELSADRRLLLLALCQQESFVL